MRRMRRRGCDDGQGAYRHIHIIPRRASPKEDARGHRDTKIVNFMTIALSQPRGRRWGVARCGTVA